jgi:hypothetical protein
VVPESVTRDTIARDRWESNLRKLTTFLLGRSTTLTQLRVWSRRQWQVAAWSSLASFLMMGLAGETLPIASIGRKVPVEWWNYLTLAFAPILIGLILATFVSARQPQGTRLGGAKASAGIGGAIGTIAMACPACSPLAIPLFGTAGVLSFLAPDRWLIALLSMALLLVTLALRLRNQQSCTLVMADLSENEEVPAPSR